MAQIIEPDQIKTLVRDVDVLPAMEEAFIQYSNGNSVVPPVGELSFEKPPGDVHIKYGYIKGEEHYVIKIASGFYENHLQGLPTGAGLMLLFKQKTGQLEAILLDEGYLTDVRTAAAGALAAKYFAPNTIEAIGIIGTGVQARMQLQYINQVKSSQSVWVWGRDTEKVGKLKADLDGNFDVQIADSTDELSKNCNMIVTTTASKSPLLSHDHIQRGTTIIAMGSDTLDKRELEGNILKNADLVIADSIPQSKERGEVFQATKDGSISYDNVVELGEAIQNPDYHRDKQDGTIVVDLTGVAVQDMMIASAVYRNFKK